MSNNEEQEKSYTINDRRGQEKVKAKEEKSVNQTENKTEPSAQETQNNPTINFTSFVLSISTSALVQMGLIPDPVSNETQKNMPLAKQQVDILEMLYQKTQGNLDENEDKLMQQVLYELRMRYVEVKDKK
ncbi:MAG TPA: DUF1844 domain-containing protein [Oligoflexia bacterium]|nr:DUF1844 domain-containing protein [Oligoflexia bacterium]HMR24400.1 DUF1844 domain-containing protein [Oligoflexia bacterium]